MSKFSNTLISKSELKLFEFVSLSLLLCELLRSKHEGGVKFQSGVKGDDEQELALEGGNVSSSMSEHSLLSVKLQLSKLTLSPNSFFAHVQKVMTSQETLSFLVTQKTYNTVQQATQQTCV